MMPLIETLESREFLSASVLKHDVVSVHKRKHHHDKKNVHVEVEEAAAPEAGTPAAWNDLAGDWAGTFSNNVGFSGSMSASFENRHGVSDTGTFDLSAMIGQSGLVTTTTPDAYGNVLDTIPAKGGIVSLVAGISSNGDVLTGRWCSHIGSTFVEGYFTMDRV